MCKIEFKNEELVEREKEIVGYLLQGFSLRSLHKKTGLHKKHLNAHMRNMMKKLGAKDAEELIQIIKLRSKVF